MWLVLSHLNLVHFFDLSCESLELLYEFLFLRLSLCGLLLQYVQYLQCNLIIDHLWALYLSLCHVLLCVFHLCSDLYCLLLERFHLSLVFLLCLRDYELCLQFLHTLHSVIDIVFCLYLRSWIVALILSSSWSHCWTC
jgi:hypothetical protein